MATCIHGTHWDGVSDFYCDQCVAGLKGLVGNFRFEFVPAETYVGATPVQQIVGADGLPAIKQEAAPLRPLDEVMAEHTLRWVDGSDAWTPAIEDAHPMRSGAHREYALATEMIKVRHSKGALIDLVAWLLGLIARGEKLPPEQP
jgi:hypothetical protein